MARKAKASPLAESQFLPNDAALVKADRERKALKAQAEKAEAEARNISKQIVSTLQARKTKKIIHQGWYITLVTPSSVVYDYPALLRLLRPAQKRRVLRRTLTIDISTLTPRQISEIKHAIGARKWAACKSEVVDPDAVSQAVQEGFIDADVVASVSQTVPGTAYIRSGDSSE